MEFTCKNRHTNYLKLFDAIVKHLISMGCFNRDSCLNSTFTDDNYTLYQVKMHGF